MKKNDQRHQLAEIFEDQAISLKTTDSLIFSAEPIEGTTKQADLILHAIYTRLFENGQKCKRRRYHASCCQVYGELRPGAIYRHIEADIVIFETGKPYSFAEMASKYYRQAELANGKLILSRLNAYHTSHCQLLKDYRKLEYEYQRVSNRISTKISMSSNTSTRIYGETIH